MAEVLFENNPWVKRWEELSPRSGRSGETPWIPIGYILTQGNDFSRYDIGPIEEVLRSQVNKIIAYFSRFKNRETLTAAMALAAKNPTKENYQKLCSAFVALFSGYDPVQLVASTPPEGLEFEYWQALVKGIISQLQTKGGFFVFSQKRAGEVFYKYEKPPIIDHAKAVGLLLGFEGYGEGMNLVLSDLEWSGDALTTLLQGLEKVSLIRLDLRGNTIERSPENKRALEKLLVKNHNLDLHLPESLAGWITGAHYG